MPELPASRRARVLAALDRALGVAFPAPSYRYLRNGSVAIGEHSIPVIRLLDGGYELLDAVAPAEFGAPLYIRLLPSIEVIARGADDAGLTADLLDLDARLMAAVWGCADLWALLGDAGLGLDRVDRPDEAIDRADRFTLHLSLAVIINPAKPEE